MYRRVRTIHEKKKNKGCVRPGNPNEIRSVKAFFFQSLSLAQWAVDMGLLFQGPKERQRVTEYAARVMMNSSTSF